MPVSYDIEQVKNARVAIIGIGGGGNNAVNRIIEETAGDKDMEKVTFIAMNTDYRVLNNSKARIRIPLGEKLTRGVGCGAKPEVGRMAAEESTEQIKNALEDIDMVFITAGMGGGTGTGAAPYVAELAQAKGILTIGVVTKPFGFEGRKKTITAEEGIEKLKANVDSLVVIPNDKVYNVLREKGTMREAFRRVDTVLSSSVKGICEIITKRGEVNIDFADLKTVMTGRGIIHMGVGFGKGENRFADALNMAIRNPLLETSIDGAKEVVLNFYGDNIGIYQMNESSEYIAKAVHPDAEIIWGYREPETETAEKDFVQVTIIAADIVPVERTSDPFMGENAAPQQTAPAEQQTRRSSDFNWKPIGF